MTTKTLSFKSLPSLAIAEGATTPNPGSPGVWAWSQTLTKPVFWNGSSWTAGSAGGGGSGDVVGPASSVDGDVVVFNGTTGKSIKSATSGISYRGSTVLTPEGFAVGLISAPSPGVFRIGPLFDPLGASLALHDSDGNSSLTISTNGQWGLGLLPVFATANQIITSGPALGPPTWSSLKTINGNSIFGTGDIVISGGSGGGITGPATSTVNHLPTFADTTGDSLQEATYFDIPAINIPAAPAAGDLRWFARNRSGRVLPHVIGPSGVDVALQPALFGNSVFMWSPSTGTTVSTNFGTSWTVRNSGTGTAQAHPTRASTNALTSMNRATFGTGTTATGSSGIQSSRPVCWRGNAANLGGFYFNSRFGVETTEAALQILIGLSSLNAALAGDPDLPANTVALGKRSTDTTWQIICRDGTAATITPTGLAITAGQVLDFTMFAPPNGSSVTFRLVDAVTGTVYVDNVVVTTRLPVNTTFLYAHAQIRSTVGTTAKLLALNRIYVETDL